MALFGKKLSLDEILKGIDELPAEDKEKVRTKMQDLDKAEDEREIAKKCHFLFLLLFFSFSRECLCCCGFTFQSHYYDV